MGTKFPFRADENVLELVVMVAQLGNILKTTELYTLKGCILCYVN